ncbi:MAG: dihydrolipoamide acyltransferase [Chloroflexi bacterium]|nr:dihydrolipoamide acyltransferase [Chloroflexota bacterium]
MITEVTMPSMGADMTEGTIVKWLFKEGDDVNKGDKIAEVETDKTVVEMEAYSSGKLKKILVPEGTMVNVGIVIAYIGDENDEIPQLVDETSIDKKDSSNPETQIETKKIEEEVKITAKNNNENNQIVQETSSQGDNSRVKASPIARKLAHEKSINISDIPGSGPGGRITKNDVENYTPQKTFSQPSKSRTISIDNSDTNLSSMRQAIARVTVKSKSTIPHYYVTHDINMTSAMNFRVQMNEILADTNEKISVNDMLLKAVANALIKFPKWNSSFEEDKLKGSSSINIGVAMALEEGLIVPAVMSIENMSLSEISKSVKDLSDRARGIGGNLTQDELTQGTFGTSNLGMFGTKSFSAIIVPPNSGIIAVGKVEEKPIVQDGKIVIASIMNATMSADHRVGDGAEAALFMSEVQKNLENPLNLI